MCQFTKLYNKGHWTDIKQILRYFKGLSTKNLSSEKLENSFTFTPMQIEKVTIQTVVAVFFNRCDPVPYSRKSNLSSTEAEYMTVCHVTKEEFWMNNRLKEVCVNLISILNIFMLSIKVQYIQKLQTHFITSYKIHFLMKKIDTLFNVLPPLFH